MVRRIRNSCVGEVGLLAKNHMQIRADYELMGLDLDAANRADLRHVFAARIERIVLNRLEEDAVH